MNASWILQWTIKIGSMQLATATSATATASTQNCLAACSVGHWSIKYSTLTLGLPMRTSRVFAFCNFFTWIHSLCKNLLDSGKLCRGKEFCKNKYPYTLKNWTINPRMVRMVPRRRPRRRKKIHRKINKNKVMTVNHLATCKFVDS